MPTSIHAAGPTGQRSPGLDAAIAGYLAENPPTGGGGASALDDLTDVDTTGQTTGDVLKFNGTLWVADSASAGTVSSTDISDSSAVGRSVLTAANAATARTAIGAGTSSFSGAYGDLSGKPTLGTAAATASTDYATAAQGAKADAAIPSGLVDAKGDLIVATAADTVARLAAGTNGHVLTADSTAAAGVKWAAAAGGGGTATGADEWGMHARRPLPGRWFLPSNMTDAQTPTDAQSAAAHYFPVLLVKPITLSEVSTYCWTAVASSGMRVAFYTITPETGKPDALIADIGSFSGEATGAKTIGSLALDLPAAFIVGMYPFGGPRFSRAGFGSFGIYGPANLTDAEQVGVVRSSVDYSAAFPASETPSQCAYLRPADMGSQQPSIYLKASALL